MKILYNNMMKLSLCIAVYNEEKNLHYPLDSAIDIVDEVVIVDGGSTDKTLEVARSYGAKVKIIKSDNPVMFHKNKQKAIEAAKGDWILQLDADEELSRESKEEIIKLINGQNENVAYWIPRKNWFLTGFLMKGGQYPDHTIRLYKNGLAKFPCKDVHENVVILGRNEVTTPESDSGQARMTDNRIGYLKNPLLHYADPDFSRYLMRWDRYTTAEVERMSSDVKLNFFNYFFWKPKVSFFMMYFRHKGFLDGFPGFVFVLFSSLRFMVIYIKWRVRNRS
jgi:glycosyltransferase involved in cell wall biosynthesis